MAGIRQVRECMLAVPFQLAFAGLSQFRSRLGE